MLRLRQEFKVSDSNWDRLALNFRKSASKAAKGRSSVLNSRLSRRESLF